MCVVRGVCVCVVRAGCGGVNLWRTKVMGKSRSSVHNYFCCASMIDDRAILL